MSTWAQNLSKILVNTSHVPTLFITSHFINLIPTASVYITALMVNSLVPLLNLFVHYLSNESSKSLNELKNHPNMFMSEFYNGVKGCINIAFLRNRKILLYMKNHVLLYLQSMTKFLSFAVIVFSINEWPFRRDKSKRL